MSVIAIDVDGDGDIDVRSASAGDNKIAWFENMTSPVTGVNFSAQVVGLSSGIRDRGHRLTAIPEFDRDTFIVAALRAIHASVDPFPDKFHDLPFFAGMSDGNSNPTIIEQLLDIFRAEFDGSQNPRLGLFEENLACTTPRTQFAWPLLQEKDNTFINFQMLQGWRIPPSDPTKTDVCLADSSGPDIGMQYAFDTYTGPTCEVERLRCARQKVRNIAGRRVARGQPYRGF